MDERTKYLNDIIELYEEKKTDARQAVDEVIDGIPETDDRVSDLVCDVTEIGMGNGRPIRKRGFSGTDQPEDYSLNRPTHVLSYDIRDYARKIPADDLSEEMYEDYLSGCILMDYRLSGHTGGLADGSGRPGFFHTKPAVPFTSFATDANQLHDEFGTFVFEQLWADYLTGDIDRYSTEPDWLTMFQELGIGDA